MSEQYKLAAEAQKLAVIGAAMEALDKAERKARRSLTAAKSALASIKSAHIALSHVKVNND